MRAAVTLMTLGVDDLDAAVRLYRDGLGWTNAGIVGAEFEHGAVAFFDLQSGLKLALWPRASITHHTGIASAYTDPTAMMLAQNVVSPAEVDAVMDHARAAGALIVKPAHHTFWGGYAGVFQDPDGHLWEIAWKPQMMPDYTEHTG